MREPFSVISNFCMELLGGREGNRKAKGLRAKRVMTAKTVWGYAEVKTNTHRLFC